MSETTRDRPEAGNNSSERNAAASSGFLFNGAEKHYQNWDQNIKSQLEKNFQKAVVEDDHYKQTLQLLFEAQTEEPLQGEELELLGSKLESVEKYINDLKMQNRGVVPRKVRIALGAQLDDYIETGIGPALFIDSQFEANARHATALMIRYMLLTIHQDHWPQVSN